MRPVGSGQFQRPRPTQCWRQRGRHFLVALAAEAVLACTQSAPREPKLLALVDRPESRGLDRKCMPDGPREFRAAFRRGTYCTTRYADGVTIWQQDARGHLIAAYRTWIIWPPDTLRWQVLQDSVTAGAAHLVGQAPRCAASAGRTVWRLPHYDVFLDQSRPPPGRVGVYQLRVGFARRAVPPCAPRFQRPAG
jgi:hypothetical protein